MNDVCLDLIAIGVLSYVASLQGITRLSVRAGCCDPFLMLQRYAHRTRRVPWWSFRSSYHGSDQFVPVPFLLDRDLCTWSSVISVSQGHFTLNQMSFPSLRHPSLAYPLFSHHPTLTSALIRHPRKCMNPVRLYLV